MTDFSLFFCTKLIKLCKIMKEKRKNILEKEIYCKLSTKILAIYDAMCYYFTILYG